MTHPVSGTWIRTHNRSDRQTDVRPSANCHFQRMFWHQYNLHYTSYLILWKRLSLPFVFQTFCLTLWQHPRHFHISIIGNLKVEP